MASRVCKALARNSRRLPHLERRNISTRSQLRGSANDPYAVKKNKWVETNAGQRDFLNESFSLSSNIVRVVTFCVLVPVGMYKCIKAEQNYLYGDTTSDDEKKFF
ncbi:hypothetical protein AAMO2058_001477400 [Amorphochlora amoebiformis]|eukprot:1129394-Amorphochlora_amoeboformis.AAC.1